MGFANAQQAAQKKNVIIAKVQTIKNENGKARVRVEKVIKGEIENVYLDIQGQDGGNCNGENIAVGEKGLYQIYLGEEFLLTDKEIKDVLAYKLQASVKTAECQIRVNRMAVPYDSNTEMNFNYDTSISSAPSRDDVTLLKTTVDLSPMAPNVRELFFYAEVKRVGVSKYEFKIRMKDPFTEGVLDNFTYQISLKNELHFAGPSLTRFTDLTGNPLNDSQQPFLSHQTHSFCALNLGHPLELVK